MDSSGWLEYFCNSKRGKFFAEPIEDLSHLIVPSISLFEIFKKVYKEKGESVALRVIAQMQQGKVLS